MKISFRCYLISMLILLGVTFTLISPRLTLAEQAEQTNKPAQIDNPEQSQQDTADKQPELKPDLPKLDIRKPTPAPVKRHQLKGSVQHSELMKPGKLEGNTDKGLFKSKSKQIDGRLSQTTETGLGIIGLKFAVSFGGVPVIYQIFPDTPAAQAGLKTRDIIIAVDGIPTFGLSKNEVYNMIVGQPGTEVTISFKHNNDFQTRKLTRMDVNDIPDPKVRRDYLSM